MNGFWNCRKNRRSKGERGSATLEFAIILPVFLLILMGIVEFGRVLMVQQMLVTAAREGARAASLPGANNDIVLAKIYEELGNAGLTLGSYEFTPADISSAIRNDSVTVSVKINYDSVAWIPNFIPGLRGMELEGVVVMRKEGFI